MTLIVIVFLATICHTQRSARYCNLDEDTRNKLRLILLNIHHLELATADSINLLCMRRWRFPLEYWVAYWSDEWQSWWHRRKHQDNGELVHSRNNYHPQNGTK